jgi:hypothetical protein
MARRLQRGKGWQSRSCTWIPYGKKEGGYTLTLGDINHALEEHILTYRYHIVFLTLQYMPPAMGISYYLGPFALESDTFMIMIKSESRQDVQSFHIW